MTQRSDSDYSELKDRLEEGEAEFIDFKVVDPVGRWRHLTIPGSNFTREFLDRGIGFDGSSYGYSQVENSDMLFVPDLSTAKLDPTQEGEVLSIIGDIFLIDEDGGRRRFPGDPRRTATQAKKYLRDRKIADEFLVSPEFEFYVFDDARFSYEKTRGGFEIDSSELSKDRKTDQTQGPYHPLFRNKGYHAPRPADSTMELRNRITSFLEREGISVKYHHHELGGAGESEIEVDFTELPVVGDNTLYVKHIVRTMAHLAGKSATFMPKPLPDFPGNGMHIHHYLVKDGENLFSGKEYGGLSQLALYFIGGLIEHGESLMGLTNPTTNSYKRLIPGHEAPVNLVFGQANRSAAIRLPGYVQSDEERRIELRTVDGTCNPYLAFSAVLMAGLDGIEREIDPRERGYGPLSENVYNLSEERREQVKSVPKSLDSALEALSEDHEYLLKGGVFKESQIENWLQVKREESGLFDDKPHPFEHMLYYDL
ncbi:MAG: type I glutamate--ammonia ligase [Candidatus Bipolaricaulota bacterium]